MKKKFKKISAFFLLLLTLFSSLLDGIANSTSMMQVNVKADEGSETISMSCVMNKNKISTLDRDASEGLWKITAGGKTTFCLNSGKSMCNGDTVKYKTTNAVTYKQQGIAKALTYYYWKSSKNTRAFALVQAYIWACGAGVDKQTTIYQAGKNIDTKFSTKDAKAFCEKINQTDPKGTIYYYSVSHCVKGKKHDKHQMLYSMTKSVVSPKIDTVSYADELTQPVQFEIMITKRDQKTKVVLSGAKFEFLCNGKTVGSAVTDEKGIASFIYNETLKSGTKKVSKKYVTNWKELSKDQQEDYTKKGYYDSKAKALQAAKKEVAQLLKNIIEDKKSQTYSWEAKEIQAAPRHELNNISKSIKETGRTETIDFGDYYNTDSLYYLEINKKSTIDDFGTDATYVNAEYGVYAKEDILGSDNKTILYKKDEKVTTIITDENGYGRAENLREGKYYLREEKAPAGFHLNKTDNFVTLDENKTITVYDTPYMGKLQIYKTYDNNKKAEAGAVFEIYNRKKKLVDTITTGADGTATTKELPYGSYIIHQIKGTMGFSYVPDITKDIDGSLNTYRIELNNPAQAARISITKTISINDKQTGINRKKPEEFAQFKIMNKTNKQVVQVLTTDENGYAMSKMLDPGTYTIHQIKGMFNYALADDFDVIIKNGDHKEHSYVLDDPWNGKKIVIQKTKEKNKKEEAEAGAEFTILDAQKATGYKELDLDCAQSRKQYIDSLGKDAVIGQFTTDINGMASGLLEDLKKNGEFLVIQTKGEDGYDLAPIYDSRDHKAKEISDMQVYEFIAKDIYSKTASIKIKKQKKISDTETIPEKGAVFELADMDGNIIEILTTAEDGTASAKNIALGTYILRQIKGSDQHEIMEDQVIILRNQDKGKTLTYKYENKEKKIDFILSKRSQETKKLLSGATYAIYDDTGEQAAVLTTGSMKEGYAACKLPYGSYTIKELKAPDGYNKNDETQEITLNLQTVNYDKDGNGVYQYEDLDEPVYGSISLKKMGEVLNGYDNGFLYDNDQISGAVYGLYAKEDIKRDDGSIVWKAGTLIDKKTTTKTGSVKFLRKKTDGTQTDQFYQGIYYIKEISGPNGYCLDTKEYEIVIHWDTKPDKMNNVNETEDVADKEEPHGNNSPYPSNGIYVLEIGEQLNQAIKNAESVTFTWEEAPDINNLIDVSKNQDHSVVLWQDKNDYYISSQKAGQVIYMNAISSKMFANCKNLKKISFKNIDTSGVYDMSEMFYGCNKIMELDLSSFNTANLEDARKMFYGCSHLKTTYVQDQIIKAENDYKDARMIRLSASAVTDFSVGDKYHAKDFVFYGIYDDEGMQELTDIIDNDITFKPEAADQAGDQKVTIYFKDTGKYKGYAPIETMVKVIDPDNMDGVSLETQKHLEINLEVSDLLQKYSIQLKKTDEKGNKLAGAKIVLKAACDIVDKNGKTIFKKGDVITSVISEDDQFGYIEFFGLPTEIYAKNSADNVMYIVEEEDSPLGYEKTDEKLTFEAKILNDRTENFIHDVRADGNTDNEEQTYIHDSKVIINKKSDKITIKKYWIDCDNIMKKRPTSIRVKVTNKETNESKIYVLDQTNDWKIQTDIKGTDYDKYQFEEISGSDEYENVGSTSNGSWNGKDFVVSYTNKITTDTPVNIIVKKQWDDSNNSDGIRPDHVKVILYQNGSVIEEMILNESNDWSGSFRGLKRTDDVGENIDYQVKEEKTSIINGNAKTGYEVLEEEEQKTDVESNISTITYHITNIHKPETIQKSIQKAWDDKDDQDKIRPESVQFHLTANGKIVDTVILTVYNKWYQTSKILPRYENGKEIKYEWIEAGQGVITGEEETGYKVSYKKDKDLTIATNKHIPGRGSVTITKELDISNLNMGIGQATFIFTLKGVDIYGKEHTYKKETKFNKDDVEDFKKSSSQKFMRISATFKDLYYGTYTCSESGMEEYFKFDHILDVSGNARVNQKSGTVTFDIGPENTNGSAQLSGKATFQNQMIKGSIKLKKKDSKGKWLKGVKFVIKDSDGNQRMEKETDDKGEVVFEGLLPDVYTITETKTKNGKNLLKEPLVVELPLSMTKTEVDNSNIDHSDVIIQGDEYYFYHLTYEITNDAQLKLPKTGVDHTIKRYLSFILGAGFILFVIFYWLREEKRRNSIKI